MPLTSPESTQIAQLPTLAAIAESGFTGWLLGDLLQLMRELSQFAKRMMLSSEEEEFRAGFVGLEVLCQASDAATVQGGKTSNTEQLNLLKGELMEFDVLIDDLLRGASLSTDTSAVVREIKEHVRMRLEVVDRQLSRWNDEEEDHSPFASDECAAVEANEHRSPAPLPR